MGDDVLPGNADGGATSGDTIGELVDGASLVPAGQALLVALTVDGNVLEVTALKLLDGGLNVLHAALNTHLLAGEVAVQTGTVPVTGDGLGLDRDLGAKLLGNAGEEETSEPELVTHLNAVARTDLELPLGGHDLGVGARDLDAGVEAGLVVGVDNVALNDLAGTNTAVVGALGSGETVRGPAEGTVAEVEEGVLLLETEPGLVFGVSLHQLGALMAVVELVGGAVGVPALGQDEDVGGATEGVGEDGNGLQVNVRVVAGRLACGRAVEVPGGKIVNSVLLLGKCLKS